MLPKALVVLAVAIQFTTVLRALLLLRVTGNRRPWVYFVAAFFLMLVAMSTHLVRLLTGTVVPTGIPAMELAMLPIATLLALACTIFSPPSGPSSVPKGWKPAWAPSWTTPSTNSWSWIPKPNVSWLETGASKRVSDTPWRNSSGWAPWTWIRALHRRSS